MNQNLFRDLDANLYHQHPYLFIPYHGHPIHTIQNICNNHRSPDFINPPNHRFHTTRFFPFSLRKHSPPYPPCFNFNLGCALVYSILFSCVRAWMDGTGYERSSRLFDTAFFFFCFCFGGLYINCILEIMRIKSKFKSYFQSKSDNVGYVEQIIQMKPGS